MKFSGIFKSKKNRAAKSLERVTEWGANGFADVPGLTTENAMQILVYNDQIISPNWSRADPPASGLNFWDKGSGEFLKAFDVREFFLRWRVDDNGNQTFSGGGPSSVSADDTGLWLCGWRSTSIIKLDWDGNLIWFNGPGDLYSDQFLRRARCGSRPYRSGRGGLVSADHPRNQRPHRTHCHVHPGLQSVWQPVRGDGS